MEMFKSMMFFYSVFGKNKMQRKRPVQIICYFLILMCCISVNLFASETPSETTLYSQINSSFKAENYPVTISKANEFLNLYKFSSYKNSVVTMKGQSQFFLGQYESSINTLLPLENYNLTAAYYAGRSLYSLKEYRKALLSFYKVIEQNNNLKENGEVTDNLIQRSALLYSSYCLYYENDFEQAIFVLENTITNFVMEKDLQPATVLLFSLYSKTNNNQKIVNVYNQLLKAIFEFDDLTRDNISLLTANAYKELGNLDLAMDMYMALIAGDNINTALEALQKAYKISLSSKEYNTEVLLTTADNLLSSYPNFKSELWVRLGISSWNEKDYKTALSYFDKASETPVKELEILTTLYRAEFDSINGNNNKALEKLGKNLDIYSSYYGKYLVQMAKYAAMLQQYDLTVVYANNVIELAGNEMYEGLYWKSYVLAKNKNWHEVYNLLSQIPTVNRNSDMRILLAQATLEISEIARTQVTVETSEIAKTQEKLEISKAIIESINIISNGSNIENTLLALLKTGNYERAMSYGLKQTIKTGTTESYLLGLAAVANENWNIAEKYLGTESPYGLYYTAYAQYRQGKTPISYNSFVQFCTKNPGHKMNRNALLYAARSALQNGNEKDAVDKALSALNKSITEQDKIDTIIFCAGIYSDLKEYNKAIDLINSYTFKTQDNTLSLRFKLAEVLAAAGRIYEADEVLEKASSFFDDEDVLETIAYYRGELFFSASLYQSAADRFSIQRRDFPNGKYTPAAIYYNAVCLDKLDNKDYAILLYTRAVSEYPSGTYEFASLVRLSTLCKETEEYSNALKYADDALRRYPIESISANVAQLKREIQLLMDGAGTKTVSLLEQWKKNNEAKTFAGRQAGLQLATVYMQSVSKQKDGVDILNKIVAQMPKNTTSNEEREVYGESNRLLGIYYREQNKFSEAANKYLLAAELFDGINKEKAAQSLYGAAESFDVQGKIADSKAVYMKMKSLYPQSEWTQKASLFADKNGGN